jgi:hypothetical protein
MCNKVYFQTKGFTGIFSCHKMCTITWLKADYYTVKNCYSLQNDVTDLKTSICKNCYFYNSNVRNLNFWKY